MKEFLVKPPFASPGGKFNVRKYLVSLIPEHKVYVEPYAGEASVLYAKEPSEKEIINDLDKWVYFAHKKIKSISEDDVNKLTKFNWTSSRQRYNKLKGNNFTSELEKLYKFLYLNWFGYRKTSPEFSTYAPSSHGNSKKNRVKSLLNAKTRLEKVQIFNKNAIEIIKKFDGKDTFFLLDPPYHDDWDESKENMGFSKFNLEEFAKAVKSIKGKFLITYSDSNEVRNLFKGNEIKSYSYTRNFQRSSGINDIKDKELIITNYPQKKYDWSSGITLSKQLNAEEDEPTRAELQQIEEAKHNWYLAKENGKKHRFVMQYHVRGLWVKDDLKPLRMALSELKQGSVGKDAEALIEVGDRSTQEVLDEIWKRYNIIYLTSALDEISKALQKVDDKRGDVSTEAKKHYDAKAPKYNELNLDKVYNIGNVHIDFRFEEPAGKYLIGWTLDVPKIVLQDLNDKLTYPLRDRVLDNQDEDQWLNQKKLKIPKQWLTVTTKDDQLYDTGESESGRFYYKASGQLVYGVAKSDYSEYFLFPDKGNTLKPGRWDFKSIESPKEFSKVPEGSFWLGSRPWKTQKPYILTHNKEEEEKKAAKDKIDMVWNENTIPALEELGYKDLGEIEKFSLFMPILKRDDEKQIVIGPVLIPNKFDSQRDIITPEEIENAAYWHAEYGKQIKLMHKGRDLKFPRVETYIYRKLKGVPEGSWVLGVKITDKEVWERIKSGEITGYSIGGTGMRRKVTEKWMIH